MEDILLFGNILDNAKPPRKYRERLLTIGVEKEGLQNSDNTQFIHYFVTNVSV